MKLCEYIFFTLITFIINTGCNNCHNQKLKNDDYIALCSYLEFHQRRFVYELESEIDKDSIITIGQKEQTLIFRTILDSRSELSSLIVSVYTNNRFDQKENIIRQVKIFISKTKGVLPKTRLKELDEYLHTLRLNSNEIKIDCLEDLIILNVKLYLVSEKAMDLIK